MKKYIFYLAAITAVFITSCRKIETDGEKEVVIVNWRRWRHYRPDHNTCKDVSMLILFCAKQNTYILKGLVYMVGNHTMTIEARYSY